GERPLAPRLVDDLAHEIRSSPCLADQRSLGELDHRAFGPGRDEGSRRPDEELSGHRQGRRYVRDLEDARAPALEHLLHACTSYISSQVWNTIRAQRWRE